MAALPLVLIRVTLHSPLGSASRSDVVPEADGAKLARRLLAAGAVTVIAGVALVGSAQPDVGGLALLAGWALLGAGIHRFGRNGSA